MAGLRTVVTVASAVVAAARHPLVRSAIRNAPRLITPGMREAASEATLEAAFRAGVLARKIVRRN
jgi:hypothetical protein